jgi:twin BRCT domain
MVQPLSVLYDVRVSATPLSIACEGSCFPQVIIHGLRLQTFNGLHIVFSSLIPLDTRPESADIWNLAEAFGATCHTELSREVTHLVAAKVCPLLSPPPPFFFRNASLPAHT